MELTIRWILLTFLAASAWTGCGSNDSDSGDAGSVPQVGDGGTAKENCSCSIRYNGVSDTLQCGTEACVNREKFQCGQNAQVEDLGPCSDERPSKPDGGMVYDGGSQEDGGTDGGSMSSSAWSVVDVGVSHRLRAISVTLGERVYIVGDQGTCLISTPVAFQDCEAPLSGSHHLMSAAGGVEADVVVVGSGGAMAVKRNTPGSGPQWTQPATGTTGTLRAVVRGAKYGYVFGDSGFAQIFEANTPSPKFAALIGLPADSSLNAAAVKRLNDKDEVWVVGTGGVIGHFREASGMKTLSRETSGTQEELNGIAILGDSVVRITEVLAVGNGGTILSRTQTGQWTAQNSGTKRNLYGVFDGIRGIYAFGEEGTLLLRDSNGIWKPEDSGVKTTLRAGATVLDGFRAVLYLVGDNGTVLTR